jgi:hypothetical protein
MTALARISSNCKRQTRHFVRKGRPTSTNPQLTDINTNLVISSRWMLYSKTDWPRLKYSSVGREPPFREDLSPEAEE